MANSLLSTLPVSECGDLTHWNSEPDSPEVPKNPILFPVSFSQFLPNRFLRHKRFRDRNEAILNLTVTKKINSQVGENHVSHTVMAPPGGSSAPSGGPNLCVNLFMSEV